MLDVNLVADYICFTLISLGENPTLLKLHKLLYYVQAWHLAFYGTPLFIGKFQAWVHGPVSPDLYQRYKSYKNMFSLIEEDDISRDFSSLLEDCRYHIESVLESYSHLSGTQLEELTHKEQPWLQARGNAGVYDRSTKDISENDMMNYYRRMQEPNSDSSL